MYLRKKDIYINAINHPALDPHLPTGKFKEGKVIYAYP